VSNSFSSIFHLSTLVPLYATSFRWNSPKPSVHSVAVRCCRSHLVDKEVYPVFRVKLQGQDCKPYLRIPRSFCHLPTSLAVSFIYPLLSPLPHSPTPLPALHDHHHPCPCILAYEHLSHIIGPSRTSIHLPPWPHSYTLHHDPLQRAKKCIDPFRSSISPLLIPLRLPFVLYRATPVPCLPKPPSTARQLDSYSADSTSPRIRHLIRPYQQK